MLPQALWGNNSLSGCHSNLPLKLPSWVALETVYHIALFVKLRRGSQQKNLNKVYLKDENLVFLW